MKKMKKITLSAIAFIFMMNILMMIISSCAYTYKGRVIDAGTKKPIESAVVVAHWKKEKGVFLEMSTQTRDVKETLTDENGEWSIRGPKGNEIYNLHLLIISHIPFVWITDEPTFIIYKPGYCSWPKGRRIAACMGGIKYHSDEGYWHGATVELPRLTNRDRRNRPGTVGMSGCGTALFCFQPSKRWDKEQKEFIKLLNQE